jgi:hypothetical protein
MVPNESDPPRSSDSLIRQYLQILKNDPRSRVFAPLAEALLAKGKLTVAEQVCRMGLEVNQDFSDGHLVYAAVLTRLNRLDEALDEIQTTLKLNPACADAFVGAARIHIAKGSLQTATQFCMQAIDTDPENREARQLLKRIGLANSGGRSAPPVENVRVSTKEFRATAGTAPSRRVAEKAPSPASLFGNELANASQDAIEKVADTDQPFSALSSGSHPPVSDFENPEEDFDIPTRPEKGRRVKANSATPIPKLPDHPVGPLSPAPAGQAGNAGSVPPQTNPAPVSGGISPLPASGPVPAGGGIAIPLVDSVQAVIDAYHDRILTQENDEIPLRVPRSGRVIFVMSLLLILGALGALVALGFRESKPGEAPGKKAGDVQSAILAPEATDLPPLPPLPSEETAEGLPSSGEIPEDAPPAEETPEEVLPTEDTPDGGVVDTAPEENVEPEPDKIPAEVTPKKPPAKKKKKILKKRKKRRRVRKTRKKTRKKRKRRTTR